MSTAYRRIHELEEAGLVQATGSIINDDGKRYYLYRSKIKAVRTVFGVDSLEVEIIPNEGMGRSAYWRLFVILLKLGLAWNHLNIIAY